MTVNDVREQLLELSSMGDSLAGGDFSDVQDWHTDVVDYVRAALGDGPADDVANRLRVSRGSTQAEKEYNAVGCVTEWIGTQVLQLTQEKIRPDFGVVVEVEPELEDDNGDVGETAGPADDPTGAEPESGGEVEVGDSVQAESEPSDNP